MKRVTSIGGVFFKTPDPEKTKAWYQKHLGLNTDAYGTNFEWRHTDNSEQKGFTQWSPFKADTEYFGSAEQSYMVNYRVEDLKALVVQLKAEGVTVLDEIEETEYGHFVHILDADGTKLQLWQPIDDVYETMVEGRTC